MEKGKTDRKKEMKDVQKGWKEEGKSGRGNEGGIKGINGF